MLSDVFAALLAGPVDRGWALAGAVASPVELTPRVPSNKLIFS